MRLLTSLFALGALWVAQLEAAPIRFSLDYQAAPGFTGSGTGFVVFDDGVILNPGSITGSAAAVGVLDFRVTFTGTATNDYTLNLSDITTFVWNAPNPLNLMQSPLLQDPNFDFNWFTVPPTAPFPGLLTGEGNPSFPYLPLTVRYSPFTPYSLDDQLELTNMDPQPVPEPSSLVLLGTGLVGFAGYCYRRKIA